MKNLLLEINLNLQKGKKGDYDIYYIKGDVYGFKDILKKYGVKWDGQAKMWFWFVDKNNPEKTLETIKKALSEVKEIQNLPIEIDEIINTIQSESPSSKPEIGITKEDEELIKSRLQAFKEMILNIENDEDFKKIMSQIIAIRGAQGYKFSLKNAILIFIQNRNAGIVNNRSNWLSKYNRIVNDNAKPLLVYAPQGQKIFKSKEEKEILKKQFLIKLGKKSYNDLTPNEKIRLDKILNDTIIASKFKLVPVYSQHDTTQIEGKEDYIKKAQDTQKEIQWFEDNMISDEVRPLYNGLLDFGKTHGLTIELVDDLDGARGVSKSGLVQILKNNGNDVGLTKTLAHEITHELLHQKYLKMTKNPMGKYKIDKMLDRGTIEQQAELSAWMFMHAFGFDIKTTSLNYTVMWGGNKENMIVVFDTVVGVVNELIKHVNSNMGNLNENGAAQGHLYTPDEVADLLGLKPQYNQIKQQKHLKESLRKKLNLI